MNDMKPFFCFFAEICYRIFFFLIFDLWNTCVRQLAPVLSKETTKLFIAEVQPGHCHFLLVS